MTLVDILTAAHKKDASDIHLKAGLVPVIRKHGKLRPLAPSLTPLTPEEIEEMAVGIMDDDQKAYFHRHKEVDVGYGVSGVGRFRVNIFRQRGSVRMVARYIPVNVPTLDQLNLPPVLSRIADLERGLVLVTGITGSGKSSTLAAMIEHINNSKNKHILTVEDPIEFLIRDRKSIISQRELGQDTTTLSAALRAALRQDPDVILVGEMRDRETMEIALTASETGHLVFSTLHTLDAKETINRILAQFEPYQHDQIRRQLASVLKAVVSQRLARRKDKTGFVPAVEILITNQRVKEMIEDPAKTTDLTLAIEESRETTGMQSFDQSLMDLLMQDLIEYDEALRLSSNPEDFQLRFSGVATGDEQWNQNSKLQAKGQAEWADLSGSLEIDRQNGDEGAETEDRPRFSAATQPRKPDSR